MKSPTKQENNHCLSKREEHDYSFSEPVVSRKYTPEQNKQLDVLSSICYYCIKSVKVSHAPWIISSKGEFFKFEHVWWFIF